MPAAPPCFTPAALKFLRALKRNNRREWFNAHRDDYEAHVRQPMTVIIERLGVDFRAFAPELVASPRVSLYRIYRDTRFSENKTPYKTHVAAVFPTRGLAKHEGAGLYFHVSPEEVWVGGGMYAPPMPQLLAVAGNSRATVHVNDVLPSGTDSSIHVTSDQPIVVERPMYFTSERAVAAMMAARSRRHATCPAAFALARPWLGESPSSEGWGFAFLRFRRHQL